MVMMRDAPCVNYLEVFVGDSGQQRSMCHPLIMTERVSFGMRVCAMFLKVRDDLRSPGERQVEPLGRLLTLPVPTCTFAL